jgi:UDP-glucose:(heptosyl)LPS alpha-1,3-glucosyltransferase
MKLALIARAFSFHGGVETATAGLLRALVAHGHEVHLYTPGGSDAPPGVVVHRLRVPREPSLVRLLWMAVATARAVRGADHDVVQSHERTLSQDVYRAGEGCHRAYLAGSPRRRQAPYHRILLRLERRLFRVTPCIVAIAKRGKEEIERIYRVPAARVRVIYNGVDLDWFHPDNRTRYGPAVRARIGVSADAFTVLFVGSGFERKGLGPLLEGFALAEDRGSRLIVLGKGDPRPFQGRAERLGIADRVVWAGPRPDVERWYAAADVVAVPSRYEPFGNVHLEALASGVPVLTSTVSGGAEVVQPGGNGILVEPDDPRGIAAGLDRLRAEKKGALTEAAWRSAQPFTYAAQVSAFEAVYRAIPGVRRDFR